jgi:hypothetical protein
MSVAGLSAVRFTVEAALGVAAVGWQVNDGTARSPWSPGARAAVAVGMTVGGPWAARLELSELFYSTDIRGVTALERQLFLGAAFSWAPGVK